MSSEATTSSVPEPLRGRSAAQLNDLSTVTMRYAALPVIPIAFESYLGSFERWWAGLWLATMLAVLTWSQGMFWHGWRKRRDEVASGYTTLITIYVKNFDLYLLDAQTFDVVLTPTLPLHSLDVDRQIASMRGERTYLPDSSMRGIAAAHETVRSMLAQQPDRALVNPARSAPKRPRHSRMLGSLPVVAALVGVAVIWSLVIFLPGSSTKGPTHNNRTGHSPTGHLIRHVSVEQKISVFEVVDGVICNGGRDIDATTVGQTFTCTSNGGRAFEVVITNPASGEYLIE